MKRLNQTHKDTHAPLHETTTSEVNADLLFCFRSRRTPSSRSRNIRKLVTIKSTVSMTTRADSDQNLFHNKNQNIPS